MGQSIYIKESDIPLTKHRKTFIKKLIIGGGAVTYSDPECTIVQCDRYNAFRSISELHDIVRTRFKLTSLQALIKLLKEIINEETCVILVYCTQINKVVVKYIKNTPSHSISNYSRDHYYTKKGVDGFSLKDYDNI